MQIYRFLNQLVLTNILFLLCVQLPAFNNEIDMKPFWNDKIALANPHKGWYHHYPDNHINQYEIHNDGDILNFPGLDHIYIRLAWAYLEPQEGKFNFEIIDSIINKWNSHGLKIAFRISCKETSVDRIEQQFATPKWVMEAGAKGGYYKGGEQVGSDGPWEPVYDDPVYLSKLENFIQAFAKRYDNKPWVRYIDIGSVGDWGEGHTFSGSQIKYNYDQLKKHIDLHVKYFTQSQLVVSDDFVYSIQNKNEQKRMHHYILDQGISYRDDSILVNGYLKGYADQFTVRSPEFFTDSYLKTPNIFELGHYSAVTKLGNWTGTPNSSLKKYGNGKTGPDMFRGALRLLHATYIGYHGYADQWLNENPQLTEELLNLCGYWYFIHSINIPDEIKRGEKASIVINWENQGVAPAYKPYTLVVKLEGLEIDPIEKDAHNINWLPNQTVYQETYDLSIPSHVNPGVYSVKLKLYSKQENRDVLLAFDSNIMDDQNYYFITKMKIIE